MKWGGLEGCVLGRVDIRWRVPEFEETTIERVLDVTDQDEPCVAQR